MCGEHRGMRLSGSFDTHFICRATLAFFLAVQSLLAVSCTSKGKMPTEPSLRPREWRGVISIDSYAEPGKVRLYWYTSTYPGCIDPVCSPPGPPIERVDLFQSTSGPEGGYRPIRSTGRGGLDSALVSGLTEGRPYWFRIVALDRWGRQLLISDPVVTMPGPRPMPLLTTSISAWGRFSWSPGGDSIAYVDASVWNQPVVTILDLRTRVKHTATSYPPGDEHARDAAWSPDGRTIAYVHTPSPTNYLSDYRVWGVTLSNGARASLTAGRYDDAPAWGGTGWLYFTRGTYGPPNIPEIWRVDPSSPGSEQALTSDQRIHKYRPSVRPSDDLIVYQGRDEAYRTGLYLLAPEIGVSRPLTATDWWEDSTPVWAPDGRHVVFISTRSGHREVWSIDVTSGVTAQLTRSEYGTEKVFASWSPDGRRLGMIHQSRRLGWWQARFEVYD
jgi:hypothetical protein